LLGGVRVCSCNSAGGSSVTRVSRSQVRFSAQGVVKLSVCFRELPSVKQVLQEVLGRFKRAGTLQPLLSRNTTFKDNTICLL